jgi:hypothetical protein
MHYEATQSTTLPRLGPRVRIPSPAPVKFPRASWDFSNHIPNDAKSVFGASWAGNRHGQGMSLRGHVTVLAPELSTAVEAAPHPGGCSPSRMTQLIDRYVLGARVAPVIVVSLSLVLAISAWIPFSHWPIKGLPRNNRIGMARRTHE